MPRWNDGVPDAEWFAAGDKGLAQLARDMELQPVYSLDTETTGLNIMTDRPVFASIAFEGRRIVMEAAALHALKGVLERPKQRIALQNAKYDASMLANIGIHLGGDLADCAVMHSLLHDDKPHGLKDMSATVLGWTWPSFEETFGKHVSETGTVLLECAVNDRQKLMEYAGNDAWGTYRLHEELLNRLAAETTNTLFPEDYSNLRDLYEKTELPFTRVLYGM